MSGVLIPAAAYSRHVRLDRAMTYLALAAGVAAGALVTPVFWVLTPPIVLYLMLASRRAAPPRFEPLDDDPTLMPVRVELAVHDAVATLPSGDARRLLGDIVRQARPLFASLGAHFDPAKDDEARRQAADLVVAACDTALELARLDGLLSADSRARRTSSSRDAELTTRLNAARAELATRLADAATALGNMYASGVEHGTRSSDLVAELASELSADASARTKARADMAALLG